VQEFKTTIAIPHISGHLAYICMPPSGKFQSDSRSIYQQPYSTYKHTVAAF